jgi:hypothetical protein
MPVVRVSANQRPLSRSDRHRPSDRDGRKAGRYPDVELLHRVNRVVWIMSATGPLTLQQQMCCLALDIVALGVVQATKPELRFMCLRDTMVNKFEHCLRSAENSDRRSSHRAVKQRGRVGRGRN